MIPLWLIFIGVAVGEEFRVPFTETKEHFETLRTSLEEYGPKLELRKCDYRYCIYAKEHIDPEEILIRIPLKDTLSDFTQNSWQYRNITDHDRILVSILFHKFLSTDSSLVNAAINTFPIEFDLVFNWTEAEYELYKALRLSELYVELEHPYLRSCERFQTAFEGFKNQVHPALFECESWKWAYFVRTTRAFGLDLSDFAKMGRRIDTRRDPKTSVYTIIALVDMLNHDSRRPKDKYNSLFSYEQDPARLEYSSFREYQRGQQVFNSYGVLTNFKALYRYGFVLDYNIDDSFELPVTHLGKCKETEYIEHCAYTMTNRSPNPKLIEAIIDNTIKQPITIELANAVNAFLNLHWEDIPNSNDETYKIALNGCLEYRKLLLTHYNEQGKMALRELRRNYSTLQGNRARLIYRYCEQERVGFHRALNLIERRILAGLSASLLIR